MKIVLFVNNFYFEIMKVNNEKYLYIKYFYKFNFIIFHVSNLICRLQKKYSKLIVITNSGYKDITI